LKPLTDIEEKTQIQEVEVKLSPQENKYLTKKNELINAV
jgi:hypothetical protein